jgi:hypothetical protein
MTPATIATPTAATSTLHEQLDPIDAARGRWEAEGSGEPGADERATIPTAIVSQIGMRCPPETTSRPSAPTMMPITESR